MLALEVDFAAELRGAEMAKPGVERRFGDDDTAGFDTVVDEIDVQTGFVVNVIESVREIRGDLHSRHPRGENSEARVVLVAETIGEAGAVDEVVDEVDVVAGDRGAEEFDDADVVAAADDREELLELIRLEFAAELALEDNDFGSAESAAPAGGGGGVALGEEVVGGGADFREIVYVRVFWERVAEGGERGAAGSGGVGGETVAGGAGVGSAGGRGVGSGGFVGERSGGPESGPWGGWSWALGWALLCSRGGRGTCRVGGHLCLAHKQKKKEKRRIRRRRRRKCLQNEFLYLEFDVGRSNGD